MTNPDPKVVTALRAALAEFDRKSPSPLSEAAKAHNRKADYQDALIALAADGDPAVSSGATWLIRNGLEEGGALARPRVNALVKNLPAISQWDAQLHVAQTIRLLDLNMTQANAVADWLLPLLAHKRPFLRAWSLDAICHLARKHENLKKQAEHALAAAHQDGAASVRARARNLQPVSDD